MTLTSETVTDTPESLVTEFGINPKGVNSDTDVTRYLYAIRAIRTEIEYQQHQLKAEIQAAEEFRTHIMESKENTIEFLSSKIEAYLEASNQKSISTPAGRAGFRNHSLVQWTDKERLLAYSHIHHVKVRVTEEPDKTALRTYIETLTDARDIDAALHVLRITPETRFGINTSRQDPDTATAERVAKAAPYTDKGW